MSKQPTETVDTPAPEQDSTVRLFMLGALPDAADLPRESAQETVGVAAGVLALLNGWAANLADDLDTADDTRRRLAVLADTIAKRNLSKAATRDIRTALMIAERALGLAMTGLPKAKWREFVPDPDLQFRVSTLAAVDQEAFDTALDTWRQSGRSTTFEALLAILAGNTPETEELDTATVDDDSDIPPEHVEATVTAALGYLREAARLLRPVTPAHIGGLPPELAADMGRAIWTDAVPVLTARKNLVERGTQ